MEKEKLIKILKSYSVDAINEGLSMVFNKNKEMRERLTDKASGELAELIIKEYEK